MDKILYVPYKEKRHYNRHPKLRMPDGSEIKPLRTRYTDEWKVRASKEVDSEGNKLYERYPAMTYYHKGRFYHHVNLKVAKGKWIDTIEVVNGWIVDAHPRQSEEQDIPVLSIWCEDGVPMHAKSESGREVWNVRLEDRSELEHMLHIDGRQEKRGPKGPKE